MLPLGKQAVLCGVACELSVERLPTDHHDGLQCTQHVGKCTYLPIVGQLLFNMRLLRSTMRPAALYTVYARWPCNRVYC